MECGGKGVPVGYQLLKLFARSSLTNRSRAGAFPVVLLGLLRVLLRLGVVMLAFVLLGGKTHDVKTRHLCHAD